MTDLKVLADSIEEPSMTVDFLLVLLLDDEDELHRNQISSVVFMG